MTSAEPGASRRLLALLLGLAAAVAVVDQVTKQIALGALDDRQYVPLIGEYLGFRLVFNPGAAFSLASGTTWLFTLISAVVVVVILRYARRLRSVGWAVALGLLLGGAIGNLGDRLFRDPAPFQGHVIDFISYYDWFVGNIADIAIVVAAILISLLALLGKEIDGSTAAGRDTDGSDDADGSVEAAETGADGSVEGAGAATEVAPGDDVAAANGAEAIREDDPATTPTTAVVPEGAGTDPAADAQDDDVEALDGAEALDGVEETRPDVSVAGSGSTDASTTTTDSAASSDSAPAEDATPAEPERLTRRELRRRREAAEAALRAGRPSTDV